MRCRTSPFEDFIEVMSRIPWWVNVILAVIAYSVLHSIAMTFYDPAPKLEMGQLGQYAADKMKGSLALFGQFVIPFGLVLSGLVGLIKKYKRTGQYKELVFYVILNILFLGSIIPKEGSIENAMQNRITDNRKPQVIQNQIPEEKQSSEAENELKALQGILKSIEDKQSGKTQNQKNVIYSWKNEKGQKVYSNIGFPEKENYTDPKIEWQ